MQSPQIIFHHVSYHYPNREQPIITNLSATFHHAKIGLVGRNGCGKSTLLKLIAGELTPSTGKLFVSNQVMYFSQTDHLTPNETVADYLNINAKRKAIARILNGSIDAKDFAIVQDDWQVEANTQLLLLHYGLHHLSLDQHLINLSGGERTRLKLAKIFSSDAEYILLDEPTNHLDIDARNLLYQAIKASNKHFIIVSHDRNLLNTMDDIAELNQFGLTFYGGNYQHYHEQKQLQEQARIHDHQHAKKILQQAKTSIQNSREKREQKQSYGKKLFRNKKIDKMAAKSKRGRSERTQSRLVTQSELLLKNANQQLQQAKSQLEMTEHIHVDLPKTVVPQGKVVLDIQDLSFAYSAQHYLIHQLNYTMTGPKRIAFMGKNGSGKSTLIKLILGILPFTHGRIHCGVQPICYLDQHNQLFDPKKSLIENYLTMNPDCSEVEAHHALAQFMFRNTKALLRADELSAGERLRAELCAVLLSEKPPQLLILDEPNNHLDLESMIALEQILNAYQGALIVISHDEMFLKQIHIEEYLFAPFGIN